MKSALCDRLGIEFPLFAFSHCRDVVAEVSRAGGMGVFESLILYLAGDRLGAAPLMGSLIIYRVILCH